MDILSDTTKTLPETSTVTPAQTKPIGSTKRGKEHQNPKVTPTPTKDRQTPVTDTPSKDGPTFKPFQFFNPRGIFAYKPSPMTQTSTLDESMKSPIPVMDDEPWDMESTKRVTNTSVKDVKLPLSLKNDDFTTTYSTDDDDIDSLAEPKTSYRTKVLPYPGYRDFGAWLESQFAVTIQTGTETFIQQLNLKSEEDIDYWFNSTAKDYIEMFGSEQYDKVRMTLAEIITIRKYIHQK